MPRRAKFQKGVYVTWFSLGTLINITFFVFPITVLWLVYIREGCLKDMSRNRVTFLPISRLNASDQLFHTSSMNWNNQIKQDYNGEFIVFPSDLSIDVGKGLCGDNKECPVYSSRYEVDHLIWLFLYIGYIAIADVFVNTLHSWLVYAEFRALCESFSGKLELLPLGAIEERPHEVIEERAAVQHDESSVDRSTDEDPQPVGHALPAVEDYKKVLRLAIEQAQQDKESQE